MAIVEAGPLYPRRVGTVASILLTTAGVGTLLWLSKRHGFLGPVVLALLVRFTVMIIAHEASLASGDQGFFHVDDAGYLQRATAFASDWSHGVWHDPSAAGYGGTYLVGYEALLGALFVLTGPSLLFGTIVNIVLGSAVVLVSGLIARRLFSETVARRAAWICAVLPTAVWWSVTLTKEPVITLAFVTAVLGYICLPDRRAIAALSVSLIGLLLLRPTADVALIVTAMVVEGARALNGGRPAVRRFAAVAAFATGVAGLALLVMSMGGWFGSALNEFWSTAGSTITFYHAGLQRLPLNTAKIVIAPFPWAFDAATRNWYRALYPGMWVLFVLYLVGLVGAWRGRYRQDVRFVVCAMLVLVLLLAFTIGVAFRQRSAIEPLVAVLAAAGAWSAAQAWRAGLAGLTVAGATTAVAASSWVALVVGALGLAGLIVIQVVDRSGTTWPRVGDRRTGAAEGPTVAQVFPEGPNT